MMYNLITHIVIFVIVSNISTSIIAQEKLKYISEWNNSSCQEVAVRDSLVYIAAHLDGLWILDISDNKHPIEISHFDTDDQAICIALANNYAFVGEINNGLRIIDISNPYQPFEVGSFEPGGGFYSILIENNIAYLTWIIDGLFVLDISDPLNVVEISRINTGGYASDIAIKHNHVFLANKMLGLKIIDVADKSNPKVVGSYPTDDYAEGIEVINNVAFLSIGSKGVAILDIVDPSNPMQLGFYNIDGYVFDVSVVDNYMYVANSGWGIEIVDISDLINPVFIERYAFPFSRRILINERNLFVSCSNQGLLILESNLITDNKTYFNAIPTEYSLYQNYPNPFNPTTEIKYAIKKQSTISLKIYDILGEEVLTLVDKNQDAGYYKVIVDATKLSSGIYFYRLQATPSGGQADGYVETKKMLLMK